eukprot:15613063-Heterocapsa_arctica.AAC.1
MYGVTTIADVVLQSVMLFRIFLVCCVSLFAASPPLFIRFSSGRRGSVEADRRQTRIPQAKGSQRRAVGRSGGMCRRKGLRQLRHHFSTQTRCPPLSPRGAAPSHPVTSRPH